MGETFERVRVLVEQGEVRVSDHGYDEMYAENISARDVLAGVFDGVEVEDYPTYAKGPCVLVLQRDLAQQPIHVVWGIPKNLSSPAVVVTSYRPNPDLWSEDFMRRKT